MIFYATREAVRNAALHGRGGSKAHPLALTIEIAARDGLCIRVSDTGVGLRESEAGGAGGGLALHATMLALLGGELEVAQSDQGGTAVTLRLPSAATPQPSR